MNLHPLMVVALLQSGVLVFFTLLVAIDYLG